MPTRPTFRDVHQDAALTAISQAYRNEEYIASQILPLVKVNHISDKYYVYDTGPWFRNEAGDARRAPGERADRADYTISTGSYLCVEYALGKGVPDEVRDNADDPIRPEIEATQFVTDKLLLALEKRVADLVTGSANWANAASPATQWDNDASDVIDDIETGRESILKEIGRRPNVLLMGYAVWKELKTHPDLLDRIKYTQTGMLSADLAAGLFDVDKLLIGRAVYDSAEEGQTASPTFVWGKTATLMYVPPTPQLMVPAAGYIFEFKPLVVKVFREDQEGQDVVTAYQNCDEVITGSVSGYNWPSAVA